MPENIKLYDRDYTEVLLETDNRDAASEFLRKSGKDWLPMTISYGPHWQQRWSGRLEVTVDGIDVSQDFQLLKYMYSWPSPFEVA